MKEYIERATAIKRIKEYSLTAYDINLDNKEEFAGNSLPENYCEGLYEATELLDDLPVVEVAEVRHAEWKYYHKQNKAVCTNCSFERDLDTNFGRAVTCPNCGALMKEN